MGQTSKETRRVTFRLVTSIKLAGTSKVVNMYALEDRIRLSSSSKAKQYWLDEIQELFSQIEKGSRRRARRSLHAMGLVRLLRASLGLRDRTKI